MILMSASGFKLALNSKGLRLATTDTCFIFRLQACPEFKGIKTVVSPNTASAQMLQACPEFKGIKTPQRAEIVGGLCFKLALNSKGLKNQINYRFQLIIGFKLALNLKGLRPIFIIKSAMLHPLQDCPETNKMKTPSSATASSLNSLQLGILCTNHRAVCICGLGRSASLQILAIAMTIAAPIAPVSRLAAHPASQRSLAAQFVQRIPGLV